MLFFIEETNSKGNWEGNIMIVSRSRQWNQLLVNGKFKEMYNLDNDIQG